MNIFWFQVAFIAYAFSTLCRRAPDGNYLYISDPTLMPMEFFIWYIINNCLNISWLILFDREVMIGSLVVAALMWFTLFVPLVISHKTIADNMQKIQKYGMMKEVWMIRFMVQNALAFYCTWVTIATLLNFSIVLAYDAGVDQSVASTVSLGVLSFEIVLWLSLDFFVLHRYTNYLFAPHCVLPIAIGGSLAKNFNPWHHNTIITVILLAIALVALVVKIIVMISRHCMWKRQADSNMPDDSSQQKVVPA